MAYSNTQIQTWLDEVHASINEDKSVFGNHHKQQIIHWLNQRIRGHIDDTNFKAGINLDGDIVGSNWNITVKGTGDNNNILTSGIFVLKI